MPTYDSPWKEALYQHLRLLLLLRGLGGLLGLPGGEVPLRVRVVEICGGCGLFRRDHRVADLLDGGRLCLQRLLVDLDLDRRVRDDRRVGADARRALQGRGPGCRRRAR